MVHPPAPALILRDGVEARFGLWTRSSTVSAGRAQRPRILLLAADSVSNTEISVRVGAARQTVVSWRARYESDGCDGLADLPRSGRPRLRHVLSS